MTQALDIAVLGLSLRAGDGHATTYRALLRALQRRGHRVRFYERHGTDHADNERLPEDLAACLVLYESLADLRDVHGDDIRNADVAMLGSRVPDGAQLGDWLQGEARGLTVFHDLDTPHTLAKVRAGACDYLLAGQIAGYDLYLSCAGGPLLAQLQRIYGARAQPLYCAVDAEAYASAHTTLEYDLGFLGRYRPDRQRLLHWYLLGLAAAWPRGRFVVAGSQYPTNITWPDNVARIEQLAPADHCAFYSAQAFALNLTRADMLAAGWSPGMRLFEAAACGVPVISDVWPGIESFFEPGREILLAHEPGQVLEWLRRMPTTARKVIGAAARRRVLAEHTADHRAQTFEEYVDGVVPRCHAVTPIAQERAS